MWKINTCGQGEKLAKQILAKVKSAGFIFKLRSITSPNHMHIVFFLYTLITRLKFHSVWLNKVLTLGQCYPESHSSQGLWPSFILLLGFGPVVI